MKIKTYKIRNFHLHLILSHLHLIMFHYFSLSFNVGPNHFSFAFNSVPKMFLFAVPCVYDCRSIQYLVFHDKTLVEIIKVKPGSIEEMSEITGIGEAKIKRYGQVFLDILLSI